MRKLLWKRLSPPSQQQPQQQNKQQVLHTEPTFHRTSPLDIVELREHIFSYLGNADLRRSVLPVCREWFWLYRHLFAKETIWDVDVTSPPLSNKTIKSINGSGRLYWHYNTDYTKTLFSQKQKHEAQWNELIRALAKNHTRYQQTRRRRIGFRRSKPMGDDIRVAIFDNPLRHLDFIAFQNLDSLLPTILPFLTFLTTLRLRSRAFGLVSLDAVLKACPQLETFQAGNLGVILELPGPWIPTNKKVSEPVRLPLQSFELENVTLEYPSLTSLLAACPSLKRLRLINIMFMERINNSPSTLETLQDDDSGSAPYSTQQTFSLNDHAACLLEHIKLLRLQLLSFHISVYSARTLDLKPDAILSVCPKATEWTFWTVGLTDTISQELLLFSNNVTALDLLWDGGPDSRWGTVLHQYLCQSPHLLHLRAPRTRFQIKHLDLHNRLPIPLNSYGSNLVHPPGIWRCKMLRTLHVSFEWNSNYFGKGPAAARVVFGYLSRVCPRLEELQLSSKRRDPYESKLWLGLEGGLCLLASLRYLERLHIGSSFHHFTLETWELSWMTTSGLNLDHRRARQARMVSWETQILQEERDDAKSTRVEETAAVGGSSGMAAPGDAILKEELRNLGKKEDVRSMLEQVDSGRLVCWPCLHKISLYDDSEIGRHPAAEMRRLFPGYVTAK